jgi:flagellar hook-length control protein FliK
MSETVASTDILRSALDISKGVRGADGNNLALSDQIQFSSILKTLVDTPEEAMAAAQGEPNPLDRMTRPEPKERDTAAPRDDSYDDRPAPKETQQPRNDQPAANDTPRRNDSDDRPKMDTLSDKPAPKENENVAGDDAADDGAAPVLDGKGLENGVKDDFVVLTAAANANKPITLTGQATESHGQVTSQSAQSVISAALTDKNFTKVGEDIHNAVQQNKPEPRVNINAQAAGNALANKQAQDLALKIGNNPNNTVQVSVNVDNGAARSVPNHVLSAGQQLAAMDPNGDGDSLFNNGQQRAGANGVSPDRQLKPNPNAQNNANQGQLAQQDANAAFAQSLRLQAQAIGAQQAAQAAANAGPKFQPVISADSAITGVNGPAGPSQVSQTAKLNPTTAARQPEQPQKPAEQIAVNIQKAFGEGADKISIKLNPAHLGRVEVKMEIGMDGKLSAVILAEKPETLDMLQKDVKGLERALQAAGLDTDSDSLNFGLKQRAERHADPSRERENSHGGRPSEHSDMDEDEVDQSFMANQHVYGRNMATNGGVDIRI